VTPPPSSKIRCRRIWLLHLARLSVAGLKTDPRSGGGRARGSAAQAHRDGVHVELVAGDVHFWKACPIDAAAATGAEKGRGGERRWRRWP